MVPARLVQLPLVVHERMAWVDVQQLFRSSAGTSEAQVVAHSAASHPSKPRNTAS